jgi:hypothetical protein
LSAGRSAIINYLRYSKDAGFSKKTKREDVFKGRLFVVLAVSFFGRGLVFLACFLFILMDE